jgi:hypothetical protein
MMKNFAYATLILATACATLSISHAAHADAYRWVSDDGVINFSQRKPRGIPEDRLTRINAKSRSRTVSEPFVATSPTDEQDDEVELTATQQKLLDDLEQTEAERQADIARIRNDNCARARGALATLTARSRFRVENTDGSQRALPEDERQELISNAQRNIAVNCAS